MEQREAKYRQINRIFTAFYLIFCAALVVIYAIQRDMYHLGISAGAALVPAGIVLFYRIFHFRPVEQLNFLVLAFLFLAWPLGSCVDFYRMVPGFDKLAHTLSGAFVGLLCLILYYALKPGHAIESRDCALPLCFMFFGSMAVAGLWEIAEYFVNLITGIDVQRVATTGVADTVQDMIVCLIGTVAVLPFASGLCRGRRNALTGSVEAFVALNLHDAA